MKVIWVFFSLFTLLLAPFSVGQARVMNVESTNMSQHQGITTVDMHAAHQTTSASNEHDCCPEQLISDVLTDSCESLECEQDCGHCLGSASYFATLHINTCISPYVPVSNNATYLFSLQVIVASPQTPPPNA